MSQSDELAEFEAQGRKFAAALFDAGFDAETVEDACAGPFFRRCGVDLDHDRIGGVLCKTGLSAEYWRSVVKKSAGMRSQAHAFFCGVVVEIEARR